MFELLLTICLAAQPTICAERLSPVMARTKQACMAASPAREAEWMKRRPDHAIAGRRCAPIDEIASPDFPVEEIADGVFVHEAPIDVPTRANAGDLANTGFIVGDEAVAVVDAGGSRAVGERLYAAIRIRTDLPIRWLALTHMHPDHTLGASVFREAGARIIGHDKLAGALASRAETYAANFSRLIGARAYLGTTVELPDEPARDRIELGGREIEIRRFPTAHTDNDLTVFDPRTGTLFAGDLVFAAHTPAVDGSILGWRRALDELVDGEAARVVPGHGPASLPWPEGADAVRGYLRVLTDETRAAIRNGESMRDAIEHIGESMRPDWLLFDEYNPRNATAAYKELEWE